jgi:hypothetical protein
MERRQDLIGAKADGDHGHHAATGRRAQAAGAISAGGAIVVHRRVRVAAIEDRAGEIGQDSAGMTSRARCRESDAIPRPCPRSMSH